MFYHNKGLQLKLAEHWDVPKYGTTICWNDTLYVAVFDNSNNCNRCALQDIDVNHDCNACKANPELSYVWVIDRTY